MMRVRRNEASFHRKSSPTQETSFYYKESLANSSLSKDETSGKRLNPKVGLYYGDIFQQIYHMSVNH